jgi:predicted nucleotidyltransferase
MEISSIEVSTEQLTQFCKRWNVSELAVFGSVLRKDFNQESDIDLLISFKPNSRWGLFDMVEMESELEDIFKKEIDLVEKNAVLNSANYIRRKGILDDTQIIYQSG